MFSNVDADQFCTLVHEIPICAVLIHTHNIHVRYSFTISFSTSRPSSPPDSTRMRESSAPPLVEPVSLVSISLLLCQDALV